MTRYVHYCGDTFEMVATIQATVNGVPVSDFTGHTLSSQVRDPKGVLIANLTCTWIDATQGVAQISAQGLTTNWPPTNAASMNVRLITANGKVISSDTITFEIQKGATQ